MREYESKPGVVVALMENPRLFPPQYAKIIEGRDPVYARALEVFPLRRLSGVKALGYLQHEISNDLWTDRPVARGEQFHHDRVFGHSLPVARTLELILQKNGFSQEDVTRGILAGVLHDIATPAGGDEVMALDKPNLREEDHWRDVLDDEAISFIQSLGISLDSIDQIIKNEGILGEALDIADRIAYTYIDTYHAHKGKSVSSVDSFPFEHVHFDRDLGRFYFDAFFLENVLNQRSWNHWDIYRHPSNRGRDHIIRALTRPFYSADGSKPLSPQRLRAMTDYELNAFLHEQYPELGDTQEQFDTQLSLILAEYQYCEGEEEVQQWREHMKVQRPEKVFVGSEPIGKFDQGLEYLIRDFETGNLIPYPQEKPIPMLAASFGNPTYDGSYFAYFFDTSLGRPIDLLLKEHFR